MSTSEKNTALAQEILTIHLEGLLQLLRSGEATAADRAVALKTLQAMEVEMKATPTNSLGQMKQALTDDLPFAGTDQPTTYQ